ncbi:hypothetical protein XthCFBP4691_03365 [Xanthomonas theicola]|uniref:Uncharacterized protein n=1 Tax=Xanthomonas theicola TaxID=56464 RepID=A0A2S6ZJW7_9XANT|nr:hypothetical protein [Xanthomonas theicola]PPT92535.1 hypothetical protein XthCFBP4691_03365 [Xanthomonas theicola]
MHADARRAVVDRAAGADAVAACGAAENLALDAEQGRLVPPLPEDGRRPPEATPRPRLAPALRHVAVCRRGACDA